MVVDIGRGIYSTEDLLVLSIVFELVHDFGVVPLVAAQPVCLLIT